jgi:hypothetical protein
MKDVVRLFSALAFAGSFMLTGCPATLPDDYEPNETLAEYFNLGTVAESPSESSWSATISPAGDHDFYGITAPDPSTIGFPLLTPEHFTLTVRLVPPQALNARNYDLYLYSELGTVLDSSTNPDSAEETIVLEWDGTVGEEDSADFRVEVRSAGGDFSDVPYLLYASLEETSP